MPLNPTSQPFYALDLFYDQFEPQQIFFLDEVYKF